MAGSLRRYTTLMSLMDMLTMRRITLLPTTGWKDMNDRRVLELYREKMGYGSVVALCLTEAAETFHHWQIFAGGDSGVCVEFDKEGFMDVFRDEKAFRMGTVDYLTLDRLHKRMADRAGENQPTTIETHEMPFMKRYGFRAEEEFRVIGSAHSPTALVARGFDLSIIKRITFSPFLNQTLVETMIITLTTLMKSSGHKFTYARSTLTNNDSWFQTLNLIAGLNEVERTVDDIKLRTDFVAM